MGFRGEIRAGLAAAMASCAALLCAAPVCAADSSARILNFESLPPLTIRAGAAGTQKAVEHRLEFDAYGKRFDIALEENARLSTLLQQKTRASSIALFRGSLEGVPGSWVRLAARGSEVRGMIWDGAELYAIEKAGDVASSLVQPLEADASATVIFRLSDTLLDAGARFCGADDAAAMQKGADAYESLLDELKGSVAAMRAPGATARIELSVVADAAFAQSRADEGEARDDILLRLNNVDGIFSSQLDVEVEVPSIDVAAPGADPFSSTTSASALLTEVGRLRKQSPHLRARGLTHLFTGRELDGATVGIAYLDSLCHAEYAAGLTEITTRGAWLESLVTAHEIGHNFGASHDGQGTCASTPQNVFLMSPSVSTHTSAFSQCSLNTMRSRVQSASCIAELPPPDLAIGQIQTVHQAVDRPFEWQLAVTNIGGSAAQNARIEISIPPAIEVESASVSGGSCISGAGITFCYFGDVAAGASRSVQLTLSSDTLGSSSVSATVAATHDALSSNNTSTGTIAIDAESDISVSLQAPASVAEATSFQGRYTITNLSARDASNVVVTVEVPTTLSATAFSLPNAVCTQQSGAIQCTLSALAAGAAANGTVTLLAQIAGGGNLRARAAGSYIDPVSENDLAEQSIIITGAPATIQSASPGTAASNGGGGGGGSTGVGLLLALSTLLAIKKRKADRASRLDG
jgi:hypothetical protein